MMEKHQAKDLQCQITGKQINRRTGEHKMIKGSWGGERQEKQVSTRHTVSLYICCQVYLAGVAQMLNLVCMLKCGIIYLHFIQFYRGGYAKATILTCAYSCILRNMHNVRIVLRSNTIS